MVDLRHCLESEFSIYGKGMVANFPIMIVLKFETPYSVTN